MRKLGWFWAGKRRRISIVLIIIAIIVVVGVWSLLPGKQPVPQVPTIPVKLVQAKYMDLPVTATAMGSLVTPQDITLRAQQAGAVTRILVQNGQQVRQGQLLLTLQDTTQQAAVAKAEAQYWQAKQEYDRMLATRKSAPHTWIIAENTYDQVVATYRQAVAMLNTARQNEAETRVVAPFSGRVGVIPVTVGSYVGVGDSLVPLVDRQDLAVQYQLPETQYALVQPGQKVTLTTPSYPNQTFTALVNYIAPSVNQVTRAFVVRAQVDNSKALLSPGMLVQVQQTLVENKKVLVVPALAIVPTIDSMTVYRIKDNKVYSQRVKLGSQHQQWAIIKTGLKAGDSIIASGDSKARLGSTVKVVKP